MEDVAPLPEVVVQDVVADVASLPKVADSEHRIKSIQLKCHSSTSRTEDPEG